MRMFFPLLVLLLGCLACSSEPSNTDNTTGDIPVASENQVSDTGGFVGPAVAPDLDIPETNALLTNYWVFEFYVDRKDRANTGKRVGTWYQFAPDGTFTSGQWQEQTNTGVWSVRRADGKVFLTLDSNVDALDTEYDLQGMTQSRDAMSWVGTKRYATNHVMLKAINLLTQPTKKQFGVTE